MGTRNRNNNKLIEKHMDQLNRDRNHLDRLPHHQFYRNHYRRSHLSSLSSPPAAAETGGTADDSDLIIDGDDDINLRHLSWDWELSSSHDVDLFMTAGSHRASDSGSSSGSGSGSGSGSSGSSSDSGEEARQEMAANARKRRLKRCCCIMFVLFLITFGILLAIPCTRDKLFNCCCGKKKKKKKKKKSSSFLEVRKEGGDDNTWINTEEGGPWGESDEFVTGSSFFQIPKQMLPDVSSFLQNTGITGGIWTDAILGENEEKKE